jgi:hypothetical protein
MTRYGDRHCLKLLDKTWRKVRARIKTASIGVTVTVIVMKIDTGGIEMKIEATGDNGMRTIVRMEITSDGDLAMPVIVGGIAETTIEGAPEKIALGKAEKRQGDVLTRVHHRDHHLHTVVALHLLTIDPVNPFLPVDHGLPIGREKTTVI